MHKFNSQKTPCTIDLRLKSTGAGGNARDTSGCVLCACVRVYVCACMCVCVSECESEMYSKYDEKKLRLLFLGNVEQ